MQYDRSLDCLIREVVIADPALVNAYILKTDISDGFYFITLWYRDAPKLGFFFHSYGNGEELVAIPLNLPTGWKKSPPIFCTATEKFSIWPTQSLAVISHPDHINRTTLQKWWSYLTLRHFSQPWSSWAANHTSNATMQSL